MQKGRKDINVENINIIEVILPCTRYWNAKCCCMHILIILLFSEEGTHLEKVPRLHHTKKAEFHRVMPISTEFLECDDQRLSKLNCVLCSQDLVVVSFLGNWPELNAFVTSLSGIEEVQLSYQKEYTVQWSWDLGVHPSCTLKTSTPLKRLCPTVGLCRYYDFSPVCPIVVEFSPPVLHLK